MFDKSRNCYNKQWNHCRNSHSYVFCVVIFDWKRDLNMSNKTVKRHRDLNMSNKLYCYISWWFLTKLFMYWATQFLLLIGQDNPQKSKYHYREMAWLPFQKREGKTSVFTWTPLSHWLLFFTLIWWWQNLEQVMVKLVVQHLNWKLLFVIYCKLFMPCSNIQISYLSWLDSMFLICLQNSVDSKIS